MKDKKIVILSGGLDSSVLLAHYLSQGCECKALTINYGQRHAREIIAATKITASLVVEHQIVNLSELSKLMTGSSQTDDSVPVPHGHYAEENMKKTVVPNRNMILLAVAGAWAISEKASAIAYAAHAGDHAIYPDCREEFVCPLSEALKHADWHPVDIERPFLNLTKAKIAGIGAELQKKLNYNFLADTYSCYEGKELHCGLCGTCQERRSAFRDAGVKDPTQYDPTGLEKLPDDQLKS